MRLGIWIWKSWTFIRNSLLSLRMGSFQLKTEIKIRFNGHWLISHYPARKEFLKERSGGGFSGRDFEGEFGGKLAGNDSGRESGESPGEELAVQDPERVFEGEFGGKLAGNDSGRESGGKARGRTRRKGFGKSFWRRDRGESLPEQILRGRLGETRRKRLGKRNEGKPRGRTRCTGSGKSFWRRDWGESLTEEILKESLWEKSPETTREENPMESRGEVLAVKDSQRVSVEDATQAGRSLHKMEFIGSEVSEVPCGSTRDRSRLG